MQLQKAQEQKSWQHSPNLQLTWATVYWRSSFAQAPTEMNGKPHQSGFRSSGLPTWFCAPPRYRLDLGRGKINQGRWFLEHYEPIASNLNYTKSRNLALMEDCKQ